MNQRYHQKILVLPDMKTVIRSSSRDIWTWLLQRQPTAITISRMDPLDRFCRW